MIPRKARNPLAVLVIVAGALVAFSAPARADFGIELGSFTAGSYHEDGQGLHALLGEGATPDSRAGAHPPLAATSFSLTTTEPPQGGSVPQGAIRDAFVELPPGFVGNPNAVPKCPVAVLTFAASCPNNTVVGVAVAGIVTTPFLPLPEGAPVPGPNSFSYSPVYNMVPSHGEPALFAFYNPNPSIPILIHPQLDASRNYALTAKVTAITNLATIYFNKLALWGVPAESSHDPLRGTTGKPIGGAAGTGCLKNGSQSLNPVLPNSDPGPESVGSCPSDARPAKPFLANPATCNGRPVSTTIHVDSWQQPGRLDGEGEPDLTDPNWKTAVAESPAVEGCAALEFGGPSAPVSLAFQPRNGSADTPSAYDVTLQLPYSEIPGERANPTLRDTTVTLPEGVVVNPSSANGLGACTSAQIGLSSPIGQTPIRFTGKPQTCPGSSKIGTVEVTTPLIDHTLLGAVYLAKQYDNPFNSLLAIYIVIDDPETGTIVKLPGRVETDKLTGQLTSTFSDNPQLPFTELNLDFFGGPGAALMNPLTCGTKTTTSVLTPASAPQTPALTYRDSFQVGAGCVASEAQAPNAPSFEAGTAFTSSTTYSPFVIKLSREDGTQRFSALNLSLPKGLTGRLVGTPYCPEAAIAQAQARSHPGDGALEQASPSCPAASQVGTVNVAAGAGSQPVHVQGKAYLAGPYKGTELSLVVITPAVAGPFDLGTVVVRTPLYVDEETAQISARSDAFPSILEGIPLNIRSIAINLDKPEFTLTPSSCEAMAVSGEAIATTGQVAPLHNRFQVGGCRGLDFKPRLALKVFGKTNRNAKPRLRAVLRPRPGEANISRAQVNLPHSLFLEQAHIKTICTRVQWVEGAGHGTACPKGSIYGRARAFTPLLAEPLEGPVYLRSNGGARKLPDVVAALRGQINIALWGKVDSGKNGGLRNTFQVVPDAPVDKFILEMRGGKRGLLVNSENLCSKTARKRRAIVRFTGHNGAIHQFKPRVANQCKKAKRKKAQRHRRHRAR